MIILLTLLCAANIILLLALACTGKEKMNKTTKIAYGFMATVLSMDIAFALGGVFLW